MSWVNAIADVFVAGVRKPRASAIDFISGFTYSYNAVTGRHELTASSGGGGGGTGDVVGPASSVNDRVVLFSGTTGKLLKQASFLIGDLLKANGSTALAGAWSLGNNALTDAKGIGFGTGPYDNVDSGTAKTIDFANGDLQKLRLTGNCTLTIVTGTQARNVTVIYKQDPTGGRTLTHPGSVEAVGSLAVASAGDAVTVINYLWDGTTLRAAAGSGSLADGSVTTAKLAGGAVTGPKLVAGADGQQLIWLGQWHKLGSETAQLTNVSATYQYSTATQFYLPAATNTTGALAITLGVTGMGSLPNAGNGAMLNLFFLRAGYTHPITVLNGGTGGGTKLTIPTSSVKPLMAQFYFDSDSGIWELAGWTYITLAAA